LANQHIDEPPSPLSYGTVEPNSHRLGIVGLCCALVTPCAYLLIFVLRSMNLHPGWRAAVTMLLLAFASAFAGLILSLLSWRREPKNGWAAAGLVLSGIAFCFNCLALGMA